MMASQKRRFGMKSWHALPLLVAMLVGSTASLVHAQSDAAKAETPLTREQVKQDRDEFIRTHRWDQKGENWVLKSGMEPPTGMKTRATVKAERDEFMRTHRWDLKSDSWIPTETPKNMSTLTRAQVKADTQRFLSTHEWDARTEEWVQKKK